MTKLKTLIILIVIACALGVVVYYTRGTTPPDGAVMCTMEAMLCPDGSYVGRSGPKCEFAKCPEASAVSTEYKDASYVIEGETVTLKNGESEVEALPGSASKIVTKYFGNEARGDLNDDGREDVAFILTQDTGGSGTFYYIVVALATEAGYSGTNAVFLGDRIAPQTTEIKNGEIIVNYADRKKEEPMTATPSVGVSKYLELVGGDLVAVN